MIRTSSFSFTRHKFLPWDSFIFLAVKGKKKVCLDNVRAVPLVIP